MREKGLGALKYKVIILDEVHERSVESDLVLLCLKQFLLKNRGLRLTWFSFSVLVLLKVLMISTCMIIANDTILSWYIKLFSEITWISLQ